MGVFIFNLKSPPTAQPKNRLTKIKNRLGLGTGQDNTRLRKLFGARNKPSQSEADPEERQGILRGPSEAVLTSHSYTTAYSESMSYSYGSNSREGVEILRKLNSEDESKDISDRGTVNTVAEVPEQTGDAQDNGHTR